MLVLVRRHKLSRSTTYAQPYHGELYMQCSLQVKAVPSLDPAMVELCLKEHSPPS